MRRRRKTEAQKKKEAKDQASSALEQTKRRLGLGPAQPPKGVKPNPLVAKPWVRRSLLPPTSDRIPGPTPKLDLMHRYKWKRGAEERLETITEIRKKATQIAPAYNKGALQYLPRSKKGTD